MSPVKTSPIRRSPGKIRTAKPVPAVQPDPVAASSVQPGLGSTEKTKRRRSGATQEDVLRLLVSSEPLRAKQVVAQLGLEEHPANDTSIRGMMERLVKAGRARVVRRGLYTAEG
jgi:hypothetical protein